MIVTHTLMLLVEKRVQKYCIFLFAGWYQGFYDMVRDTSNIVPNLNKKWGLNFEGPCGASEWRFQSIKK